MKRGNENGHMRREEVEALDDEDDDDNESALQIGFQKASAEVLARRKIVRTKRPGSTTGAGAGAGLGLGLGLTGGAGGAGAGAGAANPFQNAFSSGGFNFPSQSSTSNGDKPSSSFSVPPPSGFSASVPLVPAVSAPSEKANPFAGFQGLKTGSSAAVSAPMGRFGVAGGSAKSSLPPTTFAPMGTSSKTESAGSKVTDLKNQYSSSSVVSTGGGSDYKQKMQKLNNSFFNWVKRQMDEKPLAIWKEGLKDYLKYAGELAKEAADDAPEAVSADANNQPSATIQPTKPMQSSALSNSFSSKDSSSSALLTTTAPSFSFGSAAAAFPPPAAAAAAAAIPPPSTATTTTTTTSATSFPAPSAAPKSAPFSFGGATTFGGPPSSTSAPAAAPAPFAFGAPLAPASNTGGFKASGFSFTNNSSLSFGSSAPAAAPAAAPGINFGTVPTAADDDGEAEPILEIEKVLKNDKDNDIILHEVACVLNRFDKESKEWKSQGKGTLRITKNPDTKKQRMIVRNGMGKLSFNASFFPTMEFTVNKNTISFGALVQMEEIVEVDGQSKIKDTVGMQTFVLRVKDENLPETVKKLKEGVASTVKN